MTKQRIDTKTNKAVRMLELFLKISQSTRPISVDDLAVEEWGSERTRRRILNELNEVWEREMKRPLFSMVDSQGRPVVRGERFLQLNDLSLDGQRAVRLAVFPAITAFLKVLDGTIIAEELKPIFKAVKDQSGLDRAATRQVAGYEKKFVYVSKGMKDYSDKSDVLDAVYDALIRELLLKVKLRGKRHDETREHVIRPLALAMYNNGLYLIAQYEGQKDEDKKYKFKIESIAQADALRHQRFTYPKAFDPAKELATQFGLFGDATDAAIDVELVFVSDPKVQEYVRDRQYTPSDVHVELPDGRMMLKFKCSDLTEVRPWVLGWGANVEVIKPAALRRDIIESINRAAQQYQAPSK